LPAIYACKNYISKLVATKEALHFGKGKPVGKDHYEFHKGAKIFHYDKEVVQAEFGKYDLFEIMNIDENQPMFLIKCKKNP